MDVSTADAEGGAASLGEEVEVMFIGVVAVKIPALVANAGVRKMGATGVEGIEEGDVVDVVKATGMDIEAVLTRNAASCACSRFLEASSSLSLTSI